MVTGKIGSVSEETIDFDGQIRMPTLDMTFDVGRGVVTLIAVGTSITWMGCAFVTLQVIITTKIRVALFALVSALHMQWFIVELTLH